VIVAADRLTSQAANAFLKTLEEPPAKSVLLLLTTEPQRMLETVLSRCLRLSFVGDTGGPREPERLAWLRTFCGVAAGGQQTLLGRYQLLGVLLTELARLKTLLTDQLTARSPLQRYDDLNPELRDRWETELAAAIEAEYRRQRGELLACVQWWLRDVWLLTHQLVGRSLTYPEVEANSRTVATNLSPEAAMENLGILERTQWLLASNVQEALALEVGLLKLKLQ
jgi:DNA polymerase-3 subunit delta'